MEEILRCPQDFGARLRRRASASTYDAENRLTNAAGVSYYYEPSGRRIEQSNGKLYVYGMDGEVLAEGPLGGPISTVYVHFAGRRIARREVATNTVSYYFSDHLGSASVVTSATGTIVEESDYYPFGGERIITNSDPNPYKFTGKERDTETGLDYAIFRYYNSRLGRFMSPDLLAGGVDDPQSLNRYAYVLNDPVNLVDPLGLDPPERERDNRTPHYEIVDARTLMLGARDSGNTCILNGIATSCGVVYRIASTGQGAVPWVLLRSWRCTGPHTDGGCHGQWDLYLFTSPLAFQNWLGGGSGKKCPTGFGAGVLAGGNADAGVYAAGATIAGSAGAGGFYNSETGLSGGAFASGAAVAYAGSHVAAAPAQRSQPRVSGAYAGYGPGLFVTNAGSTSQLKGPFDTLTFNIGIGFAKLSVSIATDKKTGVVFASATGGPAPYSSGVGFSITTTTTNTAVASGGECE